MSLTAELKSQNTGEGGITFGAKTGGNAGTNGPHARTASIRTAATIVLLGRQRGRERIEASARGYGAQRAP